MTSPLKSSWRRPQTCSRSYNRSGGQRTSTVTSQDRTFDPCTNNSAQQYPPEHKLHSHHKENDMPQENTDSTRNESSFGNALAPFLYMQVDQPPTGSGGAQQPSADGTLDNPDGLTDATTPSAPSTTDAPIDDSTAPVDQPPTGSGG